MSTFRCDWRKNDGFTCGKKPYMEIYPLKVKDEDTGEIEEGNIEGWNYKYPKFQGSWSYLCWKHYILAKLKGHKFCCCRVDNLRETLENIKEELWDIQGDIFEIKDKLNIKSPGLEELERIIDEQSNKNKRKKDK